MTAQNLFEIPYSSHRNSDQKKYWWKPAKLQKNWTLPCASKKKVAKVFKLLDVGAASEQSLTR